MKISLERKNPDITNECSDLNRIRRSKRKYCVMPASSSKKKSDFTVQVAI